MSTAGVPRPRSAAEIFDASVRLVRGHYGPLVSLTALFYIPFVALQTLAFPSLLPFRTFGNGVPVSPAALAAWTAVSIIWHSTTLAVALTLAAADASTGNDPQIPAVLRGVGQRLTLAIALAIVGLGVLLLAILCGTIPSVVLVGLALRFLPPAISRVMVVAVPLVIVLSVFGYTIAALAASLPILVLERLGVRASMRRSLQLTKELRAHVLRLIALVYLFYFGLYFGIGEVFRLIGHPILSRIGSATLIVTLLPFVHVPFLLLYYDLRIRKEGYDIEVMAGALESSATPQVA